MASLLSWVAHNHTEVSYADFNQGLSLMAGTFVFLILGVLANVLVSWQSFPGRDKSLLRILVTYATVCFWLPWFIVYMSQMFPLPGVFPIYTPESKNCSDSIYSFGTVIGGAN